MEDYFRSCSHAFFCCEGFKTNKKVKGTFILQQELSHSCKGHRKPTGSIC